MARGLCTNRGWMWVSCSLVCLLLLSGCSGKPAKTVAVNGKVVDAGGAPVPNAGLSFSPTGKGYAATGTAGPDGTFQLSTFEEFDGIPPGEYTVLVTDAEGNGLKVSGGDKVTIESGKTDLEIKVEK